MNRKSFAFMLDWIPVFQLLDTKEEYDEVFEAIRAVLNDEEPAVTHSKSKKVWEFIEPKLRENTIKYEEAKAKRLEALKKYNDKRHVNDTSTSRQRSDNDTTDDSVTVTDTVTVTVTDTVTDTVSTNPPNGVLVDSVKENSKEKRFIKPTLEEIELFIFDNNYSVDAEAFFDYYESIGWHVGKKKMKDWKAAVRTWQKREQPKFGDSFFDVD